MANRSRLDGVSYTMDAEQFNRTLHMLLGMGRDRKQQVRTMAKKAIDRLGLEIDLGLASEIPMSEVQEIPNDLGTLFSWMERIENVPEDADACSQLVIIHATATMR